MDMITTADDLEFYEDLEFYSWLDVADEGDDVG